MKVIIAEKPSVAKDIAMALGNAKSGQGYWEAGGYVITNAIGHLVEIDDSIAPEKWAMSTLPILPQQFKYKPNSKTYSQFKVVKGLVQQATEVVIAADAGREGELIARLILNQSGYKGPIKRLWTSEALTKDVVRREMNNLKDGKLYESLYHSANARAHGDWIVGINMTRGMTLKAGGAGNLLSVGRVQTPVLRLVVDRDNEIDAFKPEEYYNIKAKFEKGPQAYEGVLIPPKPVAAAEASMDTEQEDGKREDGIRLSQQQAESIVSQIRAEPSGQVKNVDKQVKKDLPPLFHSLTTLQREANALYGFSAKMTLDIAQKLYETYKCLTEDNFLYTKRGAISIKDVKAGDEVLAFDEANHRTAYGLVSRAECTGVKPVYEVELAGGRMLRATNDHQLMCFKYGRFKWEEMQNLAPGDYVASFFSSASPLPEEKHPKDFLSLARMLGEFYENLWVELSERIAEVRQPEFIHEYQERFLEGCHNVSAYAVAFRYWDAKLMPLSMADESGTFGATVAGFRYTASRHGAVVSNFSLDGEFWYLAGFIAGDGLVCNAKKAQESGEMFRKHWVSERIVEMFGEIGFFSKDETRRFYATNTLAMKLFASLQVKTDIHPVFFTLPESYRAAFLAGLVDAGNNRRSYEDKNGYGGRIGITVKGKQKAIKAEMLFASLGILAELQILQPGNAVALDFFDISVSRQGLEIFGRLVAPYLRLQQSGCQKADDWGIAPDCSAHASAQQMVPIGFVKAYENQKTASPNACGAGLSTVAAALPRDPSTELPETMPISFEVIQSISHVGEEAVYDITVPAYSNFFANNILVHNCQSYPRTDAQHLGDDGRGLAKTVMGKLGRNDLLPRVDSAGRRTFDSSKLTDHHAIIPLDKVPQGLSDPEQKIYNLVFRKFVGSFYDPYEYEITNVVTGVKQFLFKTQGKVDKRLGWKELYKGEKEKEQGEVSSLPPLNNGDTVKKLSEQAQQKFTQPPARHTEASLLAAMKKLNLGTPATRAACFEVLKNRTYIVTEKKSLISTPKGKEIIKHMKQNPIASPEMTAKWEEQLEEIFTKNKGYAGYAAFMDGIRQFTADGVKQIQGMDIAKMARGASPKAVMFAKSLAQRLNQRIPPEALSDGEKLKAYIDAAMKQLGMEPKDPNAPKEPAKLSDKQLAVLEKYGHQQMANDYRAGKVDFAKAKKQLDDIFKGFSKGAGFKKSSGYSKTPGR